MTARRRAGLGLLVLLGAATALAGCGYSFRGNLPAHLRTVAVPVFVNRTAQPAVENFLTRAVVNAFSTNGRLRVVRPENADCVLDGEVTGYQLQSVAYDPTANVRQYRLIVTMNVVFRDVRNKSIIFEQKSLQERADFNVAGTVSETISLEETSVQKAADDIARSIVSRAVDRF